MINRFLYTLLTSFIFLLPVFTAQCQNLSTKGKDFWIGFLQGANESPVTMHVYISSDFATSGTVSIPLNGWSQDFTVAANSTTDIIVPTNLCEADANQVAQPKGVHVVADTIVSVYALDYEQYTADATVILPTPSLGYDYWVVSQMGLSAYGFPSDFMIVSVTDSTIIEITPSSITSNGNPADVPFTVTLNAGETYMVQQGWTYDYYGDLTGSRVRAVDSIQCHKFALFAGTRCSNLPPTGGFYACDMLYEEMVPAVSLGKKYYTVPLKSRLSDFIRVVSTVDNTQFTIDGGAPITLTTAGDYYDYIESSATIFSADQPIAVAEYSPSSSWDYQDGDPFFIMISPIEQHLNLITFNAFNSNVITSYYLNLVTPTSGVDVIQLDGSFIGAVNFTAFANDPAYSYAQLDISQGNHTIQSDSGFIGYVYGFGGYESFGYGVGSNLNILPLSFDIVYNGDTINYLQFNDTIGCPGTFTVIAHGDTSYLSFEWDFGDGTTGSGSSVTHTYTTNGSYTITLSGAKKDQCAPDVVTALIIQGNVFNLSPQFDITYNGTTTLYSNFFDTLLCNYTVNFSALSDPLVQTYNWDFGNGDTAIGQNITYTFDSAGTYTITFYEQGDSCHKGVVTWTIVVGGGNNLNPYFSVVYNGDTTLFSGFNTTIGCHRDFEFIAYYDSTIIAWNWNFGDGATGAGQIVSHSYVNPGDFIVSLSTQAENGCFDTTLSVQLHIVDSISVTLPDTALCDQQTILLLAQATANTNLQWSTGATGSSILVSETGTYSVTATLDACTVSDTTVIVSVPKIENFLPPLDSLCLDAHEVILLQAPLFDAYLWNTGETTSAISVNDTGLYSVIITDIHNCKGSDTIRVVIFCSPVLLFPLAFSPNGDNVNDGFGAVGLHVVSVDFMIYNRWGELLFSGHGINDRWDGKYNGTVQPVDVYVYTATYVLDDNPQLIHEVAGNVTLVR